MENQLHYGDNIEVLRAMPAESIDLVYIDPPFNSSRNYNQIYNSIGKEDRAQTTAFTDTWEWDSVAEAGYQELLNGGKGLYTTQTIQFIIGMQHVLRKGNMLAYLVHIALRINEIWRLLKPAGSFYLHCDSFASHYLKLLLDSIFVAKGGEFRNEIIWCYTGPGSPKMRQFNRKSDAIFWYSKSNKEWTFNKDDVRIPYKDEHQTFRKAFDTKGGWTDEDVRELRAKGKVPENWWSDIAIAVRSKNERLGYSTQKPEKLLERIIKASSNEGDVVMDCYCGCGTTVSVAQRLGRKWIGIDISFNSILVILRRLEKDYGKEFLAGVPLSGIPKDWESAKALSLKPDDPTRKEFEKWAILTYSNGRAAIREKKGKDYGIDGIAFMSISPSETQEVILQVKSGKVSVKDMRDLHGTIERENAAAGILITLYPPTKDMLAEAKQAGTFQNPITGQNIERLKIVTIEEMMQGARMTLPMIREVLR